MVGGGVGSGPAAPVVNPLLMQQQQVPQQLAPHPLQMPPQQNLLLHRAQQQQHRQLVLCHLLGNVQGHPGGLLGGPPGALNNFKIVYPFID